jgi:electron transport complex protein RnfB
MSLTIADQVDALLPQTQCTKCGYDGCRPYAEAVAQGEAINRCPPGGEAGIVKLATLLGRPEAPLDPACGVEQPRRVAWIDPTLCIGCTKCIVACPVDAIIGAPKRMHTVIPALCSGCDLCVPVCPVDCILMQPAAPALPAWGDDDAEAARTRHQRRAQRLAREKIEADHRLERAGLEKLTRLDAEPTDDSTARKRAVVEAAIRRARERLAQR